jgi:lipopolysaccharide biosynthesis glycosyltransferase
MKTQAVTIAINDPLEKDDSWLPYAQWSSDLVKKYMGFNPSIVGEEYLKYGVGHSSWDKITSIKLLLFEIFPDADRIFYFDCDWRPVRQFNLWNYCPKEEGLYFVEDRPVCEELRIKYQMKNPYFNAGFFIADRKYSNLFKYAYDHYYEYERKWVDQCVMNQVFDGNVSYLDKRLNVKDLDVFPNSEVLAYHNGHNYQIHLGNLPDVNWNS